MIAGLSGSLLSHDGLLRLMREPGGLGAGLAGAGASGLAQQPLGELRPHIGSVLHARAVFDRVVEPLAGVLGVRPVPLAAGDTVDAVLQRDGDRLAALVATSGTHQSVWRHAVHCGLAHGLRWCVSVNTTSVAIVDVARAYARRHAEFDLAALLDDEGTFAVFRALLHAASLASSAEGPLLDRVVAFCEQHRTEVGVALRDGVRQALLRLVAAFRSASRRPAEAELLDESLTVIYRVLFLLFAEARNLVPGWHPVYRSSYSIETLRGRLERGAPPRGTWEALQAIARLAHGGCRAGSLRVPPFNGRLFSPTDAPLAERVPLDDQAVGDALAALTTRAGRRGLERISYADLGVEQLGAVYEHLLDYDLAAGPAHAPPLLVPTGRRKATGSFYTPRSLAEFLVRRTLAPMVKDATPDQVLALRVLDPAMGSGAFLVAACRFLAAAYEQALVRDGSLAADEVDDDDRAGFRRAVAQRCLFGVDVNPMAVQLGRLSLWLATLASDKPLTFLDHRLRTGNSLVGAGIEDVLRHPAPGAAPHRRGDVPLFPDAELESCVGSAVSTRQAIAGTPDDRIDQVRAKERALSEMNREDGVLERWKTAASLWCAGWFDRARGRQTFAALLDRVLRDGGPLPRHLADPLLASARATADAERFFHWTLEFPEVFHDARGRRAPQGGFDAVVGNPPWDMLRADARTPGRAGMRQFARGSGVYRLQGPGHANLYHLFLERSLRLLKPLGRAGLVVPGGFAHESSSAPLRRAVLDRTRVDTFTVVENHAGIFPVHRSLRFLLLTLEAGGRTEALPARFGLRALDALDRIPDSDDGREPEALVLPRALIERVGGASMTIPAVRSAADVEVLSDVAFRVPATGDPDGWHIRFGRELNATDDRPLFGPHGLPVLEGKQLHPFRVDPASARFRISPAAAAAALDPATTFGRPRLAYRDVAAATNRTTLIAAILPAGVVTTHTVSCLKDPLDERSQWFLCGMFNSYIANYFVRMQVGTHVTAAIVARLPVPRPPAPDRRLQRVAALSRALARRWDDRAFARLNGLAALLYGLSRHQLAHVLDTFPLVPPGAKRATLQMYDAEKV